VSAPSPAGRVRSTFISFGLWISVVAFVVIEGDALLDQSQIGHASILFMLGTACLAAAASIGLFAIITAIGLAISAAFRDEPLQQQSDPVQDASAAPPARTDPSPADSPNLGSPRIQRQQQVRPARTVAHAVRKAPSRAL
jgi:hypothetical protein